MGILVKGNKPIDYETQAQISLCVNRQVRGTGPHWCKRRKAFVSDQPDCVVCIAGRAD